MNAHACCDFSTAGSSRVSAGARIAISGPRPSTVGRRCREVAGWVVPGGILAVLPKCPACLAAYFAIGSGVGISISAAIYLRAGLVALCVASLVYFAVRGGRSFIARRSAATTLQNRSGTKSCQ